MSSRHLAKEGIDVPHSFNNIHLVIINENDYNGDIEREPIGLYIKINIDMRKQVFLGSYIYRFNILKTLFLNHHVLNVHPQLMYLFNQDYIAAGAVSPDPKRNFWSKTALYLSPIEYLSPQEFAAASMAFYYYVNKIAEREPEFLYVPMPEKIRRITSEDISVTPELKMYMRWASGGSGYLTAPQIKKALKRGAISGQNAALTPTIDVHFIRHALACDNLAKIYSQQFKSVAGLFEKIKSRLTQGRDPPLTGFGVQQALKLRQVIQQSGVQYSRVFTSHLCRAIETALIVFGEQAAVNAHFGITNAAPNGGTVPTISVIPRLSEHHLISNIGNESLGLAQLVAKFPEIDFSAVAAINLDSEYYSKSLPLNYDELIQRIAKNSSTVAVVTHNDVLQDIYEHIENKPARFMSTPNFAEVWRTTLNNYKLEYATSPINTQLQLTKAMIANDAELIRVAGGRCNIFLPESTVVSPPSVAARVLAAALGPATASAQAAAAGLPRGAGFRSNTHLGNVREPAAAAGTGLGMRQRPAVPIHLANNETISYTAAAPAPAAAAPAAAPAQQPSKGLLGTLMGLFSKTNPLTTNKGGRRTRRKGLKKRRTRRKVQKK